MNQNWELADSVRRPHEMVRGLESSLRVADDMAIAILRGQSPSMIGVRRMAEAERRLRAAADTIRDVSIPALRKYHQKQGEVLA